MDTRHWQRDEFAKAKDRLVQLDKFNAEQTDWYVVCPKCKVQLRGSLAMIKDHRCGNT